jgi:hypothetical protein
MNYTPRQLAAFLVIAAHRRRHELTEQLQLTALAAQGEGKAIKDALKGLSDAGN